MTIKEQADELIYKSATIILNDEHVAILVAIKSVEHTIEVLEELSELTKIQDLYEENVCDAIDEQTELLTELRSRL